MHSWSDADIDALAQPRSLVHFSGAARNEWRVHLVARRLEPSERASMAHSVSQSLDVRRCHSQAGERAACMGDSSRLPKWPRCSNAVTKQENPSCWFQMQLCGALPAVSATLA